MARGRERERTHTHLVQQVPRAGAEVVEPQAHSFGHCERQVLQKGTAGGRAGNRVGWLVGWLVGWFCALVGRADGNMLSLLQNM